MKLTHFLWPLLISTAVFSQDAAIDKKIAALEVRINASEKGEKLQWMDSLSNFLISETSFESDTIVKETVRYALELDSLRVATWHTANLIYFQNNRIGDAQAGNTIFKEFLPTSKMTTNHDALAKLYIEGADTYYFLQQYPQAIDYYLVAEEEARKAKNKKFEGLAKLFRGGTLSFMGNFSESSQVLQEASKIFEQTNDTFNIISAKNTLSILYSQNSFFEEAEMERNEAIVLAQQKESYGHLMSFYYNAATDARKEKRPEDEIRYLKKTLFANERTDNGEVYIPMIYASLIIAYSQQDSIAKAQQWLEKLENKDQKYTVGHNRDSYINALKHFKFAKGDYVQALKYGQEYLNLKKDGDHYEDIQNSEEFLAKTYEALGNEKEAYKHFKAYSAVKDSIMNVQKVKALTYYQTLYETEKRDAKILNQQKDIALLDAKNEIQNQWMFFGGLGLLAIFSSIILVRSRNAAKRRGRMQEDFSQDLIQAQEDERTRVARELHDSVGQKLMLLTKKTREKNDPDMENLADGTLGELRSIARGLHPATMEKLGLSAALESLVNEVDANTPIFFTHEIQNVDQWLSKDASLHFYRIVQEVLNNMVKHADAKSASITIEKTAQGIEAVIRDNGKGFEFSEKLELATTLGMKTLLERAKILKSKLKINSVPNNGTTISLTIPA